MPAAKDLYVNRKVKEGEHMEEKQISLTNLVSGYTANVRALERDISTLSTAAEELTKAMEADKAEREATQANFDALRRNQAALESERDGLLGAFMESQLQGDVNEEQRVRKRRQEIDAELAEVEANILEASNVNTGSDHASRAAELAVSKSEIEKMLPKKSYEQALNNPLLQTVADTLRSDADRLRKLCNAIKLPSAPTAALQAARQQRGLKQDVDPAFLKQQEEKREARKKEARRSNINAGERKRRAGTPAHTGTTPSGYEELGRLGGDAVRAALAEKSA